MKRHDSHVPWLWIEYAENERLVLTRHPFAVATASTLELFESQCSNVCLNINKSVTVVKMQALSGSRVQISGACRRTPACFIAARISLNKRHVYSRPADRQCSSAVPAPQQISGSHTARSRCLVARAIASAVPTAQPGATTLGFVGIGIMGLAMVGDVG